MNSHRPISTVHGGFVGHFCLDLVPWQLPRVLEDKLVFFPGYDVIIGGPAAAAARGAKKLGANVSFTGGVGDDPFGPAARKLFADAGIDANLVEVPGERTSLSIVLVRDGKEVIMHTPAVNRKLSAEALRLHTFHNCTFCHFGAIALMGDGLDDGLHGPGAKALAEKLHDHNVRFSVDLAQPDKKYAGGGVFPMIGPMLSVLQPRDVLHISLAEADHFTGRSEPEAVVEALRAYTPAIILVKAGKQGLLASDRETTTGLFRFPVEEKNGTGAGDCASAAFIVRLAQGYALAEAAQFASAVGAIVARNGIGANGVPTESEVEDFIAHAA